MNDDVRVSKKGTPENVQISPLHAQEECYFLA
jgi:hypothetical protein